VHNPQSSNVHSSIILCSRINWVSLITETGKWTGTVKWIMEWTMEFSEKGIKP